MRIYFVVVPYFILKFMWKRTKVKEVTTSAFHLGRVETALHEKKEVRFQYKKQTQKT